MVDADSVAAVDVTGVEDDTRVGPEELEVHLEGDGVGSVVDVDDLLEHGGDFDDSVVDVVLGGRVQAAVVEGEAEYEAGGDQVA